ncbi:MAG: T9SS type A sorting domain-containing protein [Ignavibacteria bacterium]|nr:T9SS type A sorting domain-containing protein [Ignavibacteria bacterium]
MKKSFIILIFLTFFSSIVYSQPNPTVRFYFNGNDITSVVPVFGNTIFLIGSKEAGLGVYNLDSMKYIGIIQKPYAPIPSHNIRAIRKYSLDTLWICTDRGLIRLRGNQYLIFDNQNSPLPSNIVNDIFVDALGIWWIATDQGLVSKNDTVWTIYNTTNSNIPSNYISSVKVDRVGNVWVTTPNGLGMFDRSNWYVFDTNNSGIPNNNITFIEFDNVLNSKWIGTHGGLVHWIGNNFFVYDTSNSSIPSNIVTSFAFDTSRNRWIGTDKGLAFVSQQGWRIYTKSNSNLSDNYINSIFVDTRNRKFIATRNGLTIINDTNFLVLKFENSKLPTNRVQKVVEGIDLTKWIITNEGLVSFDSNNWSVYNSTNSPIKHFINDIAVDNENSLWVATDSGLIVRKNNLWLGYYRDNSGIPSNFITRVLPTTRGIWIGTDSGLVLFKDGVWIRYDTLFRGKLDSKISALSSKWIRQSSGNFEKIFVGLSRKGIAIFDKDTILFIDENNSPLLGVYITDVKEDVLGRLLVGTLEQGLFTFDSIWTAHNPTTNDFPDYYVKHITFDKKNKPWITTQIGGIWVGINDTTAIVITEKNYPFYSNQFNSVFVDLSNNIWISTNFGLYVYNKDTIKPELKLKHYNFEICQGNTFPLDFYTFYPFEPNNRFVVELSDTLGNFDTTFIIGSILSRTSRTILCYIPNSIPASRKYQLRIVSTNPPIVSEPSGYFDTLIVNPLPKPKIIGDSIICSRGVVKLLALRQGVGSNLWSFIWNVEGGILLSPPTNDTVLVRFDTVVVGKVKLIVFTDRGCSDSIIKEIYVSTPPGKTLLGQNRVCSGDAFIYSTTDSSNIKNYWSVVNGTLEKKLADNVVVVRWGNQTPGFVILKRVNQYGCTDSVRFRVDIFRTPSASISGRKEVMVEDVVRYTTSRFNPNVVNKWSVVNGLIIGRDNGDTVTIGWPSGGIGKVKLVQRTPAGCSDSTELMVRVFERVSIFGDTLVCENSDTYFEAISNLGANNQWYVSGGTFTSNSQNRRVWVKWGKSGIGFIKLVQWFPGTFFKDTIVWMIRIASVPPKPFIVDSGGYLYSSAPYGNQWYFNGQIMFGDTNRTIVPLRTGYYTVKVKSAPGCESEMSDPIYFISGVEEENNGISIYPNPSNGYLFVNLSQELNLQYVLVRDILGNELIRIPGNKLLSESVINLSELSNGTYFIAFKVGIYEVVKRIVLLK